MTRTISGSMSHILEYMKDTHQKVNVEYEDYGTTKYCQTRPRSKCKLNLLVRVMILFLIWLGGQTNKVVSKELNPPNVFSEETIRKEDL